MVAVLPVSTWTSQHQVQCVRVPIPGQTMAPDDGSTCLTGGSPLKAVHVSRCVRPFAPALSGGSVPMGQYPGIGW